MKMQINNFRNLCFKIFTYLILLAMMTSCQSAGTFQQLGSTLEPSTANVVQVLGTPEEREVQGVGEYVVASSLASLTSRATLIVLGRVKPDSRVINIARDGNDISKPDLSLLVLAQVYQVDVERVIKGVLPNSPLFAIQAEGFLSKPQASIEPSPEDAKLARQGYEYMPFTEGGRYLLFLHPLEGFEQQGFFVGSPHPWRFNATDENNVVPEGPVPTNIQPAPLAEIIKQIGTLPTPTPTIISPLPTPPPVATAKAAP